MPKVSVIIPCYNQGEFLLHTFQSLQKQSLQDFECIVVDDGSTDDSAEITRQFALTDKRFRLICKSNGGTATARNRGLQEARGEYIQFLDADDAIHQDKLLLQTERMDETGADVSYTEFLSFREENGEIVYMSHKKKLMETTWGLRFSLLTNWGVNFTIPPITPLYRHDFLRCNNLRFDEHIRYREDWDFLIEVVSASPRILPMLDYVGSFYRRNPKGKVGNPNRISEGNIIYIAYKCNHLAGIDFLLWSLRLSNEIILIIGRSVKHLQPSILCNVCNISRGGIRAWLLLLLSVILLPISIFLIFIRTIKNYCLG